MYLFDWRNIIYYVLVVILVVMDQFLSFLVFGDSDEKKDIAFRVFCGCFWW